MWFGQKPASAADYTAALTYFQAFREAQWPGPEMESVVAAPSNRRRALLAVVLVAACVALVGRSATTIGHPDPVRPTIYSKSAIGHAGLYALLEDLDIPVRASEAGSGAHVSAGDILVIAEARINSATLVEVRAMLSAASVVLVLPKRSGDADPKRPYWLGRDRLLAEADVARVLHLVDPGGAVVRVNTAGPWESRDFHPPAPRWIGHSSFGRPRFGRSSPLRNASSSASSCMRRTKSLSSPIPICLLTSL